MVPRPRRLECRVEAAGFDTLRTTPQQRRPLTRPELLVRTALGGDMKFNRVAQELLAQHPHIHERAPQHPGHRPGHGRGNQSKGFPGNARFHAFAAEVESATDYQDDVPFNNPDNRDEDQYG